MNTETHDDDRRGIQSIEVGGRLLKAAAAQGQAMPLKALSLAADMSPAKAHPYLVSFCKLGLMSQDPATGHYGLGPLALEMGLIGMQQIDPIRLATNMLEELAIEIGHTIGLAVWGSQGPTVVHVAASPAAIHIAMRHGTVVSLYDTASGPLFAAYRAPAEVKALLNSARQRAPQAMAKAGQQARTRDVPSWVDFSRTLDTIRLQGMHRSVDGIVDGVSALAAPVFDSRGHMTLALTAIGPTGAFDGSWDGQVAQRLKAAAHSLTQQIGGHPPT